MRYFEHQQPKPRVNRMAGPLVSDGYEEMLRQAFKAGYNCRPMMHDLTDEKINEAFKAWAKKA